MGTLIYTHPSRGRRCATWREATALADRTAAREACDVWAWQATTGQYYVSYHCPAVAPLVHLGVRDTEVTA